MAQQANQHSRIILWFRDDLRLHDNAIVHTAARRVSSQQASEVGAVIKAKRSNPEPRLRGDVAQCCCPQQCYCLQVIPVYCFDPRHFGTTPYGSKKTGDYRAKFLLESIQDLKQNLQKIGSNLLIHMGSPEDALRGVLLLIICCDIHLLMGTLTCYMTLDVFASSTCACLKMCSTDCLLLVAWLCCHCTSSREKHW